MAVLTQVMDVGALALFLWGFEERGKLINSYELLVVLGHSKYRGPVEVVFDLLVRLLDVTVCVVCCWLL
jgi:NADH:ubiquinone oxidoreductase subunit D